MKYIVFLTPDGLPTPILFPTWLQHKEVAGKFGVTPRSAGFVRRFRGQWQPHGLSDSLKLTPHPEDAELLNTLQP